MATSIECGTLKQVDSTRLEGILRLGRTIKGVIVFRRISGNSENQPSHQVYFTPLGSSDTEHVGVAFLKHSDKADMDWLSISIDNFDWPCEINLAAFPNEKGDEFRLVWSRPRGGRNQERAS